ncbi:MAG: T9SS type A sorting domain-containing protein, partial [Bacteroidota bacterium]|nr:T9SS type A sorting domain-containing protein [Bacteroidota bacterium]
TFTFQDFTFLGGYAQFVDVKTSGPTTVVINCINNFEIVWESNSDVVEFVTYSGSNEASLNFNVGGNFSVTGNYANAYFLSSHAENNETVNIVGSIQVSGGKVYFVSDESTGGTNGHNITLAVGTNIEISGGSTNLSTKQGTAAVTVGGDVIITGGTLNLKWMTGIATMNITGEYQQSGGIFNIHGATSATTDTCKITINGNFTQSAGTLNFDNATGSAMAEHTITFNGVAFTVSGSAVITHANNLTGNYLFGQFYFNRTGTTIYSRNSSTHNIQHVRQTIRASTIVNASSSANGFQMTSVSGSTSAAKNSLTIFGTLDMGNKLLRARQYTSYYSQLTVSSGGRYRTSHTGGLYSGSNTVASSIDGYINSQNRVNFILDANSTVEYYGTATSVVTGIPNGIATSASQQYGRLDINFTGTAGSAWVYPETTNEIFIRTSLILTAGEFNLDNDHSTSGGGRVINVLSGATISRSAGFIRSETEDGSGRIKWTISSNGSYVFPFGYNAANYIPFTYQQTSGNSGIVQLATYRTIPANTPYPPTVTHVRDVYGVDNSLSTVDRFWHIMVPGTAGSNLTFSYVASEGAGLVSPRAQLWEPVTMGWFPPAGVQSNPSSTSTLASGITSFNTWWTLSSLGSPLPIELTSFEVAKQGEEVAITWATQTEINNDFFTVERSATGIDFEPILTVEGAGNSTNLLYYEIRDAHPRKGRNYYRLKQTDFDGKFTYSEVKSITFLQNGSFHIYPNPLTSGSELTLEVPDQGNYEVRILDFRGRNIYTATLTSGNGEALKINIDSSSIIDGIYGLIITGQHASFSQKVVVKTL